MCQLPAPSYQLPAAQSAIDNLNRQSTLTKIRNHQSAISNQHLLHGFPRDFLDRGDPVHHLVEAAPAKRDHSFFDRLSPEFKTRGADENQFAELLSDFHDFVQ